MRGAIACLMLMAALWVGAVKPVSPAAGDFAMPQASDCKSGYSDADSVMNRLNAHTLHALEGVWQFPGDGGTIAIERMGVGGGLVFDLRAVAAANRRIPPGTLIGRIAATADPDIFQGHIFSSIRKDGSLAKPVEVTISLNRADASFKIRPIKKKWRFNLYRLIPYMFRMGVSRTDDTPTDLSGCVRICPPSPVPLIPVSL